MSSSARGLEWDERTSAGDTTLADNESMFRQLFERSADAIFLFDPGREVFVDCNRAAVEMMRATSKQQLLMVHPATLSPEFQPDGQSSREKTPEVINLALSKGSHRFEWRARRMDGTEFPLEVLLTAIQTGEHPLMATICRDITDRKRAEQKILELNASLEQRVAQRTAALTTSEARFRALVENAPEAIVVFDGDTGRFLFGNQHACRLYGVPMEKLAALTPADVSPEFQPGGRRSSELAREKMDEALAGHTPVFEWTHPRPDGCLIPTEVRLLRLPAEGQNLIRASIIDNTENKRAQRALRESEEKFRALFEGSSQGVVLHDENQILEVNPAAVRIMGCQGPEELLGKHPADTSPPLQPNGESSAVLARKYIQQCMANGSARFDWVSHTPQGKEIPLEVTLTRIEWSGRQVIQALINDISERKKAEAELRASEARLRESEARFSAAFRASPVFITISRMDDGRYVLANEAFLKWTDYRLDEVLGCNSQELALWADPAEREPFWEELRRTRSIHERECRARNRHGKVFTMLVSADVIEIKGVPHLLTIGQDITERKQAEAGLRAGEARLRESEARFSAAFHSSPVITGVTRASDGKFVLVNGASLNWSGYRREEVLGRTAIELGIWEDPADRERFWNDVRSSGSIQERECRLRNRHGSVSTMLASGAVIEINGVDHLLVMMVDISERKKGEAELQASEARLRESEARFSAAFQASPALIGILRMSDGKYVLANDAHLNWLGYPREEVLGRTCLELGMWENPGERDSVLMDMHAFGSIRQRECRWRNRRGKRFTILLSAETIQLNNTPHMLLIALDITERKRAEEELVKTLEREKELSQLKSNFVSMVSHEFRTPLGIIQSSAELFRAFYEKMQPGEREDHLESISRNTRRMAGMMEEVLVLSRLDAGKLIFQPAALDLNVFCRRVVDEVLSATNRQCFIKLSLNSVPRDAEADERLLGHIFTNLLSNAVKYSEPGATVHFTVDRDGHDAVCVVRDRGIGIAEEDQQQLFEAFHRGRNVGTRPGTGLGLLLVKRCAELHGGNVQMDSKIGEGTTVTVCLPVFGTNHEKNISH
jgi:PAS domain S-box-containing protein